MMITTRESPLSDAAQHDTASRAWRAARRFARTPKGQMLLVLVLLAAMAAPVAGLPLVLPVVVGAAVAASVLDALLLRIVYDRWQAPVGALLSGLFVALVIDPHEPWYVPLCAALLAVNSKWVARTRFSNVFNPAAVALVMATLVFGSGQSWWGALPDLPLPFIAVLLATITFIAARINKLPMVVTFLGIYFAIFTIVALIGDPTHVAEVFRVPTVNAALFFAGFMLTDPPTSPTRYRDQIIYAVIVAVACATLFLTLGGVYFLPAGLLVGNAWESGRRIVHARRRPSAIAAR